MSTFVIWYLDLAAIVSAVAVVINLAVLAGWDWFRERLTPRKPTAWDHVTRVVGCVLFLVAWYGLRVSR